MCLSRFRSHCTCYDFVWLKAEQWRGLWTALDAFPALRILYGSWTWYIEGNMVFGLTVLWPVALTIECVVRVPQNYSLDLIHWLNANKADMTQWTPLDIIHCKHIKFSACLGKPSSHYQVFTIGVRSLFWHIQKLIYLEFWTGSPLRIYNAVNPS